METLINKAKQEVQAKEDQVVLNKIKSTFYAINRLEREIEAKEDQVEELMEKIKNYDKEDWLAETCVE